MIDYGFALAILASIIALIGVYQFNQQKNYVGARTTWFWSNTLFVLYFAGRIAGLWDGGLGDVVMWLYFVCMWTSNAMGMVESK